MSEGLFGFFLGAGLTGLVALLLLLAVWRAVGRLTVHIERAGRAVDAGGTDALGVAHGLGALRAPALAVDGLIDRFRSFRSAHDQLVERLSSNERFLKSVLDSLQAGVCLVDPVTRVVEDVNPFALRMLGRTRDQVVGQVCHSCICPSEVGRCPVIDLGQTLDLSMRACLCADGSRKEVMKSVERIERDGRTLLLETFVDVSELIRTERALKDSETEYRTIFENAGPMVILEPGARIKLSNGSFAQLVGFERSLLEGGRDLTDFMPEDDSHVLDFCLRGLREGSAPSREDRTFRLNGVRGGTRYVEFRLAKLGDSGAVAASIFDVTETREAADVLQSAHAELETRIEERTRELQSANERLREMDALRARFLSSASHELRTPLTSIMGFAKLLLKRWRSRFAPIIEADATLAAKAREFGDNLEIIKSEGERLTRLINDLLDLNKIAAGRMQWRDCPLDLGELAVDSVKAVRGLLQDKSAVEVVAEIEPHAPLVSADPDRIRQVLWNLLTNAAKFTERGRIVVSVRRESGLLVVEVSDTGVGVPESEIDKIFETFYQTEAQGMEKKPVGTGLGLSICRQIVEHYGGDITARSRLGAGSVFTVRLPLGEMKLEAVCPAPYTPSSE